MAVIRPEDLEQIKVVEFVRQKTDLPFIHIPNAGKRTWLGAFILKRMGMCAGASDLFFPRATKDFHGLFIEMKVNNGKLTALQKNFIQKMIDEKYMALAAWGADSAIEIIKAHYHLP